MKVVALILLAAVVVMFALKTRGDPKKKSPTASRRKKGHKISAAGKRKIAKAHDFPSVSIQCGPSACQAVVDLSDHRFLANEAPKVPLPDCNSASCSCKFVHHDIRREQDEDRRAPNSMRTALYENSENTERRQGGRRRLTDPRPRRN